MSYSVGKPILCYVGSGEYQVSHDEGAEAEHVRHGQADRGHRHLRAPRAGRQEGGQRRL